jgi:hypothetical protein
MIRFKITVRMTDNTTEITIEARQPDAGCSHGRSLP